MDRSWSWTNEFFLEPAIPFIEIVEYPFDGGVLLHPNGTFYRAAVPSLPRYVGVPSMEVDMAWQELLSGSSIIFLKLVQLLTRSRSKYRPGGF